MKRFLAFALVTASYGTALLSQATWVQAIPATSPSPRMVYGMAYDAARGSCVLFGGNAGGASIYSSETWLWDGSDWTQHVQANGPDGRVRPAICYDSARQVVVMFGGYTSANASSNDTWEWDGTTWTQVSTPTAPDPRYSASMAYDELRGVCVLYGGYSPGSWRETWEYDGQDWTLRNPTGPAPTATSECGMVFDRSAGAILLHGGRCDAAPCNGATSHNESWSWDGLSWSQLQPSQSPPPRYAHGMSYDPFRQKTIVYGGTVNFGYADDTWEFDGNSWQQVIPAATPGQRERIMLAFDEARRLAVVFGGYDGSRLGTTWEYAPDPDDASLVAFGNGCGAAPGLRLAATTPRLGHPWDFQAQFIEPTSPSCLFWFGDNAIPGGVDLTFAGLPGCSAYLTNVIDVLLAPAASGVSTLSIAVPPSAALIGSSIAAQATAASLLPPAGFSTSNGALGIIGN
ncbi:MAG: kelch repeat-containing protein [Planctomycetota bacterium]